MANIIPCNLIEQEVDRLKQLFAPCYHPTAQDLDDLSDLVYSASLCGTGGGGGDPVDQNNLFSYRFTNGGPARENDPVIAINTSPSFVVNDTEMIIFIHTRTDKTSEYSTDYITEWYLLKTGKGTYGAGGTQIILSDIYLLKDSTFPLATSPGTTQPPRVLDIYADTVGGATISTPHTILNGQPDSYVINSSQDTYFMTWETEFDIFNADHNLYRFIGADGDYGSGIDTAVIGDFTLIETFTNGNTGSPKNQIKIREINVPGLIDGTTFTDIADAVNNSFRGNINIKSTELVFFIADEIQPALVNDTLNIITKKWAWVNGAQNSINTGSVVSDYTLLEVVGTTMITGGTGTNPGAVYYVEWSDISDVNAAVAAVNSLATTDRVVLDDNLVLVKISLDDGSNQYKIWEFTGTTTGNGTYGVAGLTAVAGDFSGTPVVDGTVTPTGNITASDVIYDDTVTAFGNVYNVQEAIEALGSNTAGFEAINEGNGIGLVKTGRTAANYGNIGLGSVDLSNSSGASGVRGATGDYSSVGSGLDLTAFGDYSTVSGGNNNGTYSLYSTIGGGYLHTIGNASDAGTIGGGYDNTIETASGMTAHSVLIAGGRVNEISTTEHTQNVDYSSILGGFNNKGYAYAGTTLGGYLNEVNGDYGVSGGYYSLAQTFAEIALGYYPSMSEITPTLTQRTTWVSTDRLFAVGMGVDAGNRKNAITGWKDGTWEMEESTIANISSRGAKAIISKEYGDANYLGLGDVTKVGTPANTEIAVWTGDGTLGRSANFYKTSSLMSLDNIGGAKIQTNDTSSGANAYISTLAASEGMYVDDGGTNNALIRPFQLAFTGGGLTSTYARTSITLQSTGTQAFYASPVSVGVTNTSGAKTEMAPTTFKFYNNAAANNMTVYPPTITADRTIKLPDLDGTVALDIFRTKVTLSAAQIKGLGSTPITAVTGAAGKLITVISAFAVLTYGTVAFDNNPLDIRTIGTTGKPLMQVSSFLDSTTTTTKRFGVASPADDDIIATAGIEISGTNSVATGDSTVDVYITYEITTL